ncbi:hypothetical protein PoB_006824900 [Plakobranchus ocellatus]|uniref:Uncharacterized protein n=1 Tax=Plakobranchus ocellatus TaxID=259542 RepID=A0AAV4DC59_9GAST|nr:hypothetical protein PoB_006824900 [Plakobranchus ocellatus]
MADDRPREWPDKSLDEILWRQDRVAMTMAAKIYAEVPPGNNAVNRRPGSGVYLRKKGGNHQPGKVKQRPHTAQLLLKILGIDLRITED